MLYRRWIAKLFFLGAIALSASSALAEEPAAAPRQQPSVEELIRKLNEQEVRLKALEAELRAVPVPLDQTPTSAGAVLEQDAKGADTLEVRLKKLEDSYDKDKSAAIKIKLKEASTKKEAEEKGFVVGEDLKMNVKWDHGLTGETADKAFRVHVGGRTQVDSVFYNVGDDVQYGNNGVGRVDDGVGFRRARLAIEGTLWEVIDFWMEYDFLNTDQSLRTVNTATGATTNLISNTPVPTDLWVQVSKIPAIGNVRIGNQKAPFSFEHLTSSRFLNFMERSYAFDAYVGGPQNGFEPGIGVFNNFLDDRLHLAASLTKPNMSIFGFNTGDGELAFTTRAGGFPIWEDDGRVALWVGCGYRHTDPDFIATGNRQFSRETLGQVRLRARSELRNGPAELHTALLDTFPFAESQDLLIPEVALVCGPLSVVSEYFGNWLQGARNSATGPDLGTSFTQSGYIEVLYFLTGEHRVFNRKTPGFTRVVPYENFWLTKGCDGPQLGRGAWQVGARYSWIDLDPSNDVGGPNNVRGSAHGVTLGLNWFLNPNMKIQWNYTWERRYGINPVGGANAGLFPNLASDGELRGFGMRMAVDF